ncbi:MAG: hypothetical protein U0Z17_05095 [Bacteroidales bacterium]
MEVTMVAYMDLISSGNEILAHTLENGRITFMFCSFDENPGILKLYGKGFYGNTRIRKTGISMPGILQFTPAPARL